MSSDRDRLIELIGDKPFSSEYENYNSFEWAEHFADHLLANGVIVPPVEVEQTVYCVYGNKVIQGMVRLIRPFISKEETIFKGNIICEIDSPFFDDGRKEEYELYVVFDKPYGSERVAYLTKEEAEQALVERSVDNG